MNRVIFDCKKHRICVWRQGDKRWERRRGWRAGGKEKWK